MGERTEYPHGTHSWVDLSTDDPEAAKRFYGALFGWEFDDRESGNDRTYSMAKLGGKDVAALFQNDGSLPPRWNCYVTVEDVDAIAKTVEQAGGVLIAPPLDVLESGRMLILQDPTSAFLSLWQPKSHAGAAVVNVPGALTWNDLITTDPEKAEEFYSAVLGWDFEKVDGDDDYWTITNDGRQNGGMRPIAPDEDVPPHWIPYFGCEDIEAAAARVEELGGTNHLGPQQVPRGSFVIAGDPQAARFALFAGKFDD